MQTKSTVPVDPSNADALRGWDGADGAYWTEHEEAFDRSVARYDDPLLEAAALAPGERVLDIGCGTGHITRRAARAVHPGTALGVDLSSAMLARARERAEQQEVAGARFEQADAQVHAFEPGSFDVVVSRTGCMFFGDPVVAFTNIGRALRPGGRIALLTWQPPAVNPWLAEFVGAVTGGRRPPEPPSGSPGPFSLSDPARIGALLDGAGFREVASRAVAAPMCFGQDVPGAQRFVAGLGVIAGLLAGLDDPSRAAAEAALRETLGRHLTREGVLFDSAAWITTARR